MSILRPLQAATACERTGGRVAEGARLERVYTGNRIEGSNPSLSAIFYYTTALPKPFDGIRAGRLSFSYPMLACSALWLGDAWAN